MKLNLNQIASLLFILLATIAFLVVAKNILIPFILALVIWFIIKEVREVFDYVDWIKTNVPNWLKSTISSIIVFVVLGIVVSLLTNNVNELQKSLPVYENNVSHATELINSTFNINLKNIFSDYLVDFDFSSIAKQIINSITSILGSLFMVLIYVLFLFLEESVSSDKLRYIYSTPEKYKQAKELLQDIDKSIGRYIGLKTLVSIITGVASYIVFAVIGIDSPFFWAFLIYLLNFIPVIGSLIGVLFPTTIALLQFGELTPAILVLVLAGSIQIIVGNVLEPKIMGNSLNVSSLVIILSLAIWGSIWGIFGMVISVPTTVILIIIFSRIESTKNIAILLSEKGEINN